MVCRGREDLPEEGDSEGARQTEGNGMPGGGSSMGSWCREAAVHKDHVGLRRDEGNLALGERVGKFRNVWVQELV